MIYTTKDLLIKFSDYRVPKMKIKREIDKGHFFYINRGLYEDNPNVDGYLLSQYIVSPSYLSFEYVLSLASLIPERVNTYTNASVKKRHRLKYRNRFGNYSYQDIPPQAFNEEVKLYTINGYSVAMASNEKALCDLLYIKRPAKTVNDLKLLLFEDMRVDVEEFNKLNRSTLIRLAHLYSRRNLKLLIDLLKGKSGE